MKEYAPPNPTTPHQSGGGGFTYADRVAARLLLAMLAVERPLGEPAGCPVDLRYEQRPAGELFDDLAVLTDTGKQWSVTIKSGEAVAQSGIDDDLVNRAWWMHNKSAIANANDGLLVIAQPPPTEDVRKAFRELVEWSAEQAEGQTSVWLATKNVGNEQKRDLWESVRGTHTDQDTQKLFERIRLLTVDLEPNLSSDMGVVRQVAESTLEHPSQWKDLWNALLAISSEGRRAAAQLTIDRILPKLPATILLRSHGDSAQDLQALRAWGARGAPSGRRRQIGGRLELDTIAHEQQLNEAIAGNRSVLVVGESGIGKSVTLARWCEGRGGIYLRADELLEPAEVLRRSESRRTLQQILTLSRERELLFVIDQIDRLTEDTYLGNLAIWVKTLYHDERVHLVFGCATAAAQNRKVDIHEWIQNDSEVVPIERNSEEMLGAIAASFPQFATLLQNYAPSPLLLTPRALDQLLGMQLTTWPETFAEFLDLVWINRIQGGAGSSTARETARQLAQREADDGNGHLLDGLGDPVALTGLKQRGVVQDDGRHLTWDHDSTGDQIRAIMFGEQSDPSLLSNAILNPFWRRALRLHCVATLEKDGEVGFDRLDQQLSASEDALLLQSVLFDAIVLCPPKLSLAERLAPRLIQSDRMRPFLRRFFYTASVPLFREVNGIEGLFWRANVRSPKWTQWLPVASMALKQREWFTKHGIDLGLELFVWYLEAAETDFLGASRFALLLANCLGDRFGLERSKREEQKNRAFRVGIRTLAFEHESARKFLRRSAGRIGRPPSRSFDGLRPLIHGPYLEPVPLGPRTRVDGEFRKFYMATDWPTRIAKHDPALAVELFSACLVREPGFAMGSGFDLDERCGFEGTFELPFFPATPFHPGINGFFDRSFEEGLAVVADLVDFGVQTWMSQYPADQQGISIDWGEEEHFFAGDRNVYHWADGSAVGSYVLQSLLLTLERRLLETEGEDELMRRAKLVLARTNNLALLSVLIWVAKSRTQILVNLLGPVLFSEIIDALDIEACVSDSWRLIGGISIREEWWRDQEEQFKFSRLEHRRNPLRSFSLIYLLSGDKELIRRGRERWLALADLSEPDVARALRILAALYDESGLRLEAQDNGQHRIWVDLPDDLAAQASAERQNSEESIRAIAIQFSIQKLLNHALFDQVEQLKGDFDRFLQREDRYAIRESVEIGAWLAFLVSAEKGHPVSVGDANFCRSKLLKLIGKRLDQGDTPPTYDDQAHWTSLVATHAPLVFCVPPDTRAARRALVAFIQCSNGFALHRIINTVFDSKNGLETCVTILRIIQVWAVEGVRRIQAQRALTHKWILAPSAIDLGFARRALKYIWCGVWVIDDRQALGRTNPSSNISDQWSPSNYEILIPSLLEFLERAAADPRGEAGLPVLKDLLEGLRWRSEEQGYDGRRTEGWVLVGGSFANLSEAAQEVILSEWTVRAMVGDEDVLALVTSLLRSYGSGKIGIDASSRAFARISTRIEAASQQKPFQFYMHCFGCSDRGILLLRWDTEKALAWIARHRDFYERALRVLLRGNPPVELLHRLARPEFVQLDPVLFEVLSSEQRTPIQWDSKRAEAMSQLMIRLSRPAKQSPQSRKRWRQILADLEKTEERLAWQILSEVADRV